MNQRTALAITAALTAFILVVIGGLVSRMNLMPDVTPAAAAQIDPATEALIQEREAAYRQALAEANARLEEANRQIAAANQRLQATASTPDAPTAAPAQPSAPAYVVSAEQAQTIAQGAAGDAVASRAAELVSFQGVPAYEIGFGDALIYIDAQSGAVLYNGVAPATGQVTQEQAIQAALAYLGGGEVRDVELKEEHGMLVYRVTFSDGSEIYVDPASGQVAYAEIAGGEHERHEHEQHDEHTDDSWNS
jgi:uncharacterized membrane protein YkoI